VRERPMKAADVAAKRGQTIYPEPFARRVAGRTKRKLGDVFGLTNFGVNLTHLEPGAVSALLHYHTVQDEFVFILEGNPTVVIGNEEYQLAPGDCVGFKAGTGVPHQVANRTQEVVAYIEVGDRSPDDSGAYPDDDLTGYQAPDGSWILTRKDGTPY
jgi:uncharacterized cupin superfamily protein